MIVSTVNRLVIFVLLSVIVKLNVSSLRFKTVTTLQSFSLPLLVLENPLDFYGRRGGSPHYMLSNDETRRLS